MIFDALEPASFRCIVADCPWPFAVVDRTRAEAARRYRLMTLDELAALPVVDLAHPDGAVLLCWATNRHLATGDAATVVKAWGATPKTVITWRKPRPGPGRWARGRTEHVILATIGRPQLPAAPEETIFDGLAGAGHSAKPAAFYDLAERLFPGPRVDLFARQTRFNWASWGAGVEVPA